MLQLEIAISPEGWDEEKQEFVKPKFQTLTLEHSLVSLSKWESKWCKSFLHSPEKTVEETLDYIKFMTLTQNVNPDVYNYLTQEHITKINDYISAPMTATTFAEDKNGKKNREVVTAELIYYWMISYQIPFECQKWHLNRLITLIRVCGVKNAPPGKTNKKEIMGRYASLNAQRRAQLKSKG